MRCKMSKKTIEPSYDKPRIRFILRLQFDTQVARGEDFILSEHDTCEAAYKAFDEQLKINYCPATMSIEEVTTRMVRGIKLGGRK